MGYPPMNRHVTSYIFRLLTLYYERACLILRSNKEYAGWGEIFDDQVLGSAILARLLHTGTTLNIKGACYRLKEKKRTGLLSRARTGDRLTRRKNDNREGLPVESHQTGVPARRHSLPSLHYRRAPRFIPSVCST